VPFGSEGAVNVRAVPVFDVIGVLTPLIVSVEPLRLFPLTVTVVPLVSASRSCDGEIDDITGPLTACTVSLVAVPTPVNVYCISTVPGAPS